jgi:MATE family, multidrug efflux pump
MTMKGRGLSRMLWSIALPIIFAEMSEIVLHLTNTIFLARVGVVELGAIGIADSIWEVFLVIPFGLVEGVQILTARSLGRHRPLTAGAVFNQGLLMVTAVAAALAALLGATIPWISGWLVSSPEVGGAIRAFLGIACWGIPFTIANFTYSALLISIGRTRVLVPATLLLVATNCALDYALIFGHFGAPALGIRGAAIALICAEFVTCAFLTAVLFGTGVARRYGLFRRRRLSPRLFRRLVRLSAPISAQALVEAVRWFAFFLILERVSHGALAVGNVVYSCYEVFRVPTEAFAETACSMVARFVGRDRTRQIVPVILSATRAAAFATLPMIELALWIPDWVLSVFTLDDALIEPGMLGLRIMALGMLVIIPADMWFTAVIGTGDTPAALGIEIVLTAVMLVTCYITAVVLAGGGLVWLSLAAAALVTLLVSYGWMRSGMWRRIAA